MKLLLAGDSFAELGGYRNHYTTSQYSDLDKGQPNADADVKHWAELLGEELGYDIVTHGMPGAGVSASSFVALQQLITGNYDAMIFVVSHHGRTIMHKHINNSWNKWKDIAYEDIVFNKGIDVYHNNKAFSKTFPVHHIELDEAGVCHTNAENVLEAIGPKDIDYSIFGEIHKDIQDAGITYLQQKVGFSYIHDAVTSVITLNSYCDKHNIPVVFASAFPNGVSETIDSLNIDYKHFPFHQAERMYNFTARDGYPSHYNSEEHQRIYNLFTKYYPEYKTMFAQKD